MKKAELVLFLYQLVDKPQPTTNYQGMGAAVFVDGKISGGDVGAVRWEGDYEESKSGIISGTISFFADQEGVTLIGGESLPKGKRLSVSFGGVTRAAVEDSAKPKKFGERLPTLANIKVGDSTVDVVIKKVADIEL